MSHDRIRAAIITASDTRDATNDVSGAALRELLSDVGAEVVESLIVSDDLAELSEALVRLAGRNDVNLIFTTGGTGLSRRDNTPEATRAVIEREVPGITEAIRRETSAKTRMAMLSRGIAGIRGNSLIINLPGSPKGVRECFEVLRPVLQHAIDQVCGETRHT